MRGGLVQIVGFHLWLLINWWVAGRLYYVGIALVNTFCAAMVGYGRAVRRMENGRPAGRGIDYTPSTRGCGAIAGKMAIFVCGRAKTPHASPLTPDYTYPV